MKRLPMVVAALAVGVAVMAFVAIMFHDSYTLPATLTASQMEPSWETAPVMAPSVETASQHARIVITDRMDAGTKLDPIITELKSRGFTAMEAAQAADLQPGIVKSVVLTPTSFRTVSPDILQALCDAGAVLVALDVSLPALRSVADPSAVDDFNGWLVPALQHTLVTTYRTLEYNGKRTASSTTKIWRNIEFFMAILRQEEMMGDYEPTHQ